jgi:hypothetical protein
MTDRAMIINCAVLAVKEKLPEKVLATGKINSPVLASSYFFYLLEILSPWLPSDKVENVIINDIKIRFEQSKSFDLDDFEDLLRTVNEDLVALSHEGQGDWIGNLNAILGFVVDDKIHLSLAGKIDGYLVRNNKISNITENLTSDETPPAKTFASITSGNLMQGDNLIIGNASLFDHLSIERSRQIITQGTPSLAIKNIHATLRKLGVLDANALVLAGAETKEQGGLPELVHLDQAQDSAFDVAVKKASPYAKQAGSALGRAGNYIASATSKGWAKFKSNWKTKYHPKTKEFLKSASEHTGRIAADTYKRMGPKIKMEKESYKVRPYLGPRKNNDTAAKIAKFLSNAYIACAKILKIMLKKENRRYLYIGLAVLLILVGYLKIRSNNIEKSKVNSEVAVKTTIDQAQSLYNQAVEDLALGRGDGKSGLESALSMINSVPDNISGSDKEIADSLRKQIEDKVDELILAMRYRDPAVLYSLNGDVAVNTLSGSTIYTVLTDGKIYSTDTRDKDPVLIASIDSSNGKVIASSYSDTLDAIYYYTENKKVFLLDLKTETVSEATLVEGGEWESAVDLASYSSNIYLLDAASGELWRHISSSTGYSKGNDYLDTRAVSIKDSRSVAIDGNIYILKSDASVAKFVKGSFDSDFKISELPSPFATISNPAQIYTEADTSFIYILDRDNSRIIRFEKNGQYSNQFIFDGISIDQFFVNPRVQKMWVTSGRDVYEVSL